MFTRTGSRFWLAAAASLAMLAGAPAASAAVCVGNCGSLGADGDVTAPPDVATYGYISTFGGIDGVGQLPGIGGTDGSTFTTSAFHASAGGNLQYHFNYVSSDGQQAPGNFIFEDYAFVQLVDATTGDPVAMLFNARTEPTGSIVPGENLPAISPGVTLTPETVDIHAGTGTQGNFTGGPVWSPLGDFSGWCWGPGCGLTQWILSDFEIPAEGDYRLVFGVTNWGDSVYDSGLAFAGINIDGVEIEDVVPEPSTWAVLLAGIGGLGAFLRMRRRYGASLATA